MPNLPSLNESYALLLQEEEQKACASSHFEYNSQESTAFMVKKFGNTKSKAKLVCDYCKDTRHTRDSCFVLNGYPPWFKGPQLQMPPSLDKNSHAKTFSDKSSQFSHTFGQYKG